MPIDTYSDVIENARQAFNAGDLDGYINTLYAPDVVCHFFPPGLPQGYEGVKFFYSSFLTAFPDAELIYEDILTEGDRVVIRFRIEMTHQGEFQGIPATHNHATLRGITIMRFVERNVVERWSEADFLGMMQQLGVIPA